MEWEAVALWAITFLVLSLLGLPLTSVVFDRLPGRGAGFAPTVALGVVSTVAYWVGHVRFGLVALATGTFVLVASVGLAVRHDVDVDRVGFAEAMATFLTAFLFLVSVRAVDPGLLPYIEDFLNYGLIRAILRANQLPPEDFWFAGARVRYYYGGHLAAALETAVTGTRPSVAYNLSMAGFYGMLVSGAYELTGAIAAANGRSRRVAGLLGAFFVGFAGNLLVPVAAILDALPRQAKSALAPIIAEDLSDSAAEVVTAGLAEFQYWDAYQLIPDTFTPSPLLLWLHGELHAPLASAPFFLLVVAVWYAYYRTPEHRRGRRRLLAFIAAPLASGYSLLADVWTAPTAVGLALLTLTLAPAAPATLLPARVRTRLSVTGDGRVKSELQRFGVALVLAGFVAGAVITVTAPFIFGTVSGGKESVAFVSASERSGLFALVLVHGPFLAVAALYLAAKVRPSLDSSKVRSGGMIAILVLATLSMLGNAPALVLFGPAVLAGWGVLRGGDVGFETVLVVAGAGLVLIVEFVYLANQEYVIPGRGNTVFRTYMQTWLVWGVAVGVIVPRLIRPPDPPMWALSGGQTVRTAFVSALVVSAALFGGLSVYGHFDRAFEPPANPGEQAQYVYNATVMQDGPHPPTAPPTLDGLLFAEVNHPHETRAIKWLDRNVDGTPTMVTAPGGRWEWRSAPAALTGIPTIAGWAHELVYRDWRTYYDRVNDVRTIYTGSPAERVELLEAYGVEFVYVGPDERRRYDIWEFQMLDGVSVAYRNQKVTVYALDQSELDYSSPRIDDRRIDPGQFSTDPSVSTRRGDRLVSAGPDGTLAWWGPYLTLPPGPYEVTFRLDVNASDEQPAVELDVARGGSENGTSTFRVLANTTVNGTDGTENVTIPFTLSQPASDVEFRGRLVDGNATVVVHRVTFRKR